MKTLIRYRIKDLRRSTENSEIFISNSSNSTIYKNPKYVINKINYLTNRFTNPYSFSELKVLKYELQLTAVLDTKDFISVKKK